MWRCFSSLTMLRQLHTWNFNLADIPGEVLLLNQLTSLHQEECNGYNGLACAMDLSPLQNLVKLDISGSNIGGIPAMLMTCQSLEVVKLDQCNHLRLNKAGIDVLKTLPHLKKVTINYRFDIVAQRSMDRSAQDTGRMARELPLVDFELDFNSEEYYSEEEDEEEDDDFDADDGDDDEEEDDV